MGDPFWKRTGFWSSLTATAPLAWALFHDGLTLELIIAVIGAWGAYFTAQGIRGPVTGVNSTPPPV